MKPYIVNCAGCNKRFDIDEVDDSGFCFDCANLVEGEEKPDLIAATLLAARSAIASIARRFGRKVDSGGQN